MRPSLAEVRRRVAAVVTDAERVVELRPDAAWPRAALAFSRGLADIVAADPLDPAAVGVLARAYDASWRAHQAAPSFHFLQALAAVGQVHLCRWCGYDLRASPARCPECGRFQHPADTRPEAGTAGVAGGPEGGRSQGAVETGPSAATAAVAVCLQLAGSACLLGMALVLDPRGRVALSGGGGPTRAVGLFLLGIGAALVSAGAALTRRR